MSLKRAVRPGDLLDQHACLEPDRRDARRAVVDPDRRPVWDGPTHLGHMEQTGVSRHRSMEVSDSRKCRRTYMKEITSPACLYITTTDGVFLCRGPEKATSLLDDSSLRPDEVGRREPFRGEQRPASPRRGAPAPLVISLEQLEWR